MFPGPLKERIEILIDDLIKEGGIDSASLASILVAAQESVENGYHLELSQRVWRASNDLKQRVIEKVASTPTSSAPPRAVRHRAV